MNPKSRREDPTELARPSGVVTTGTTGASAETESGTEGGEAPVAEKEALHTKAKREKERSPPTFLANTDNAGSEIWQRAICFLLSRVAPHQKNQINLELKLELKLE